MNVRWHCTPESAHRALWEPAAKIAGLSYEEMIEDSASPGYGFAEEIKAIRGLACWAFPDQDGETVHIWADAHASDADVLRELAREVGAATGRPISDPAAASERSEWAGEVAAKAYALLAERPKEAK